MIYVNYIRPDDLSDQDIRWIILGCKEIKFRLFNPETIIDRAIQGEVGIHRVSGACEGVIVTSVNADELFVELISGERMTRCFDEIHEKLKLIMAAAGLSKIAGFVARPGLRWLYDKRTRARQVAALYVEDFSDGRK